MPFAKLLISNDRLEIELRALVMLPELITMGLFCQLINQIINIHSCN